MVGQGLCSRENSAFRAQEIHDVELREGGVAACAVGAGEESERVSPKLAAAGAAALQRIAAEKAASGEIKGDVAQVRSYS